MVNFFIQLPYQTNLLHKQKVIERNTIEPNWQRIDRQQMAIREPVTLDSAEMIKVFMHITVTPAAFFWLNYSCSFKLK